MEDNQIILDIQVRYDEAIQKIAQYQKAVNNLRENEKKLKEQLKEQSISQDEYNKEMAASKIAIGQNTSAIRLLNKEIQNNINAEKEQQGSLVSLRASLSNLTRQYDEMSKAERDSASGEDLEIHINAITDQIKDAEEKTQRFYRNVGNYQEAFEKALSPLKDKIDEVTKSYLNLSDAERKGAVGEEMRKHISELKVQMNATTEAGGMFQSELLSLVGVQNGFLGSIVKTTEGLGSMSQAFAVGKTAVSAFGKQLLALLANPIVAIIAGIAAAIMGIVGAVNLLTQAFKRNEDNTAKLNIIFAKMSSVFQLFLKALEPIASFIVDKFIVAMEGLGNAVSWVIDKLGGLFKFLGFDKAAEGYEKINSAMKEMSKNAGELAKAEAELTKAERNAEKLRLDYQKQAEKLRQQRDDESKSIEERIKANEELGRVLNEQANDELRIAKLAVTAAEKRIDIYGKTAENLDSLAQAETRVSDIEERITGQQSEQLANLNSLRKEAIELQKQQHETELELIRQAQESSIALLEDGAEKQRIIINNNYDKQISDLKTRLATEKNLTKTAREQINIIISNLEKQRQKELDKISQEEIGNAISREQTRIQNLLSAVKSGSQQEFDLRLQQIGLQRKAEIEANSRLTESMRQSEAEINAKYDKQIADARIANAKAVAQKQSEELRLGWENRLLQVRQGSEEELQLRIQQAQEEYNALLNMDAEQKAAMFESDEAYTNAVLQNKNKIAEAEKNYNDNLQQSMQTQLQAYQAIGGGLESVLEAFAEDNEAMAEFSKAIALFNVGLSTAEAIASGVASSQSVPFPGNLLAIATTIGTVLANIAKAKQILSKETTPKAPKFSTGGSVVGAGSGTSDSIGARLSNGESVMTALATSMFSPILSQLNQMGGGVPINVAETSKQVLGEDMLANAFAKGMHLMPKPIVGVDEITNVTKRVNVVETMGNS